MCTGLWHMFFIRVEHCDENENLNSMVHFQDLKKKTGKCNQNLTSEDFFDDTIISRYWICHAHFVYNIFKSPNFFFTSKCRIALSLSLLLSYQGHVVAQWFHVTVIYHNLCHLWCLTVVLCCLRRKKWDHNYEITNNSHNNGQPENKSQLPTNGNKEQTPLSVDAKDGWVASCPYYCLTQY